MISDEDVVSFVHNLSNKIMSLEMKIMKLKKTLSDKKSLEIKKLEEVAQELSEELSSFKKKLDI